MAEGHLTQVIGTVGDVEFPEGELPALFSAVEIHMDGTKLVAEVEQHLGNNWARCLAMDSTDGLRRGARAVDTGRRIAVPTRPGTRGCLFNVLGTPLDGLGEVAGDRHAIHRTAPGFEEHETQVQVLETGMKIIDLIAPFTRGGQGGAQGGGG